MQSAYNEEAHGWPHCGCSSVTAAADKSAHKDTEEARVTAPGDVLKELQNGPNGIPISLLNKAECVIVLPSVKKVGFVVAGSYGRGVMSCRSGSNFHGAWSPPIMMQSSGGSFGLQAGKRIILVMNEKGARAVLHGKAKLGADASVAAAGLPDLTEKLLSGYKMGDITYKVHLDSYNDLDLMAIRVDAWKMHIGLKKKMAGSTRNTIPASLTFSICSWTQWKKWILSRLNGATLGANSWLPSFGRPLPPPHSFRPI